MVKFQNSIDFFFSVCPSFYVLRILGLLPRSVIVRGNVRTLGTSILWTVYSIALDIVALIFSVSLLFSVGMWLSSTTLTLVSVVTFTRVLIGVLNSTMLSFLSISQASRIASVFDVISNMDLKYNMKKDTNYFIFVKGLIILICSLVLITISNAFDMVDFLNKSTLIFLPCYIVFYYDTAIVIQFAIFCYSVRRRFIVFTTDLAAYRTQDKILIVVKPGNSSSASVVHIASAKDKDDSQDCDLVSTLKDICNAYDSLCDAVDAINSAFGLRLLISVIHRFCQTVLTIFYLITQTATNTEDMNVASECISIILHIASLFLLTVPCVSTVNQVSTFKYRAFVFKSLISMENYVVVYSLSGNFGN